MKINITGFTSAQRGYASSNKKGVLSFSNILPRILLDMGHEVCYDLEDADLNIVFVLDPSSINASHVVDSLETLATKKCIIAFDDWNIKGFFTTLDKFVLQGKFSRTHPMTKYEELERYGSILTKLHLGGYVSIFPAYQTGNHKLLGIRGKSYAIDPSIYTPPRDPFEVDSLPGELQAVHASLANKNSWLDKKKYTILNVKNETESRVFQYYQEHRIVLTPPHYHNGSGWYRNRYTLANHAKAVIVEDENSPFGHWYKIQRKDVNRSTIDAIFETQDKAYNSVIMTQDECKKVLKKALK